MIVATTWDLHSVLRMSYDDVNDEAWSTNRNEHDPWIGMKHLNMFLRNGYVFRRGFARAEAVILAVFIAKRDLLRNPEFCALSAVIFTTSRGHNNETTGVTN